MRRALPWLLLTLFAVFNGALIAIGRFGFGISAALPSRYLPFCTTLPIGLMFLIALLLEHWRTRSSSPRQVASMIKVLLGSATALFMLLHITSVLACLESWRGIQQNHLRTKALVHFVNIVDDRELLRKCVHSEIEQLTERINLLDRLGYLRPSLLQSNNIRQIADVTPARTKFGRIQRTAKIPEAKWGILGWAILPDKLRPADAVLLTYDDVKGDPILCALAIVGVPRKDIVNELKEPAYERCGWAKVLDINQLPAAARSLRAWAFDAEAGHAYPMDSVAVLDQ